MRTAAFVGILLLVVGCGYYPTKPPSQTPPVEEPPQDMGLPYTSAPPHVGERSVAGGLTSGTRLKVQRIGGQDGSTQALNLFWDSVLSMECTFLSAGEPDGVTRCLPVGSNEQIAVPDFYTDDRCDAPVFVVPSCDKPVQYLTAIRPVFGLPNRPAYCRGAISVWRLREVLQVDLPQSFYYWDGVECRAVRYNASLYMRFLVPDGAAEPLENFVKGTKIVIDN